MALRDILTSPSRQRALAGALVLVVAIPILLRARTKAPDSAQAIQASADLQRSGAALPAEDPKAHSLLESAAERNPNSALDVPMDPRSAERTAKTLDEIEIELLARDLSRERWDPPWEQFKSAEHYLADPQFNPDGRALPEQRMTELRALIARLNAHMFRREEKTQALLDDYVKVKVQSGSAQQVPPGTKADWKALGDGGLRVVSGYGGTNHALIIHPGEFSDLDQVMFERSALQKLGKEKIASFFNQ